jgi:hypothetical protein
VTYFTKFYKFPKKERKEFNAFSLTDSYHSVFFLVFALGPCSQAVAFLFKPLELAASEVTVHEGPALFTFCKPNILKKISVFCLLSSNASYHNIGNL